MNENQIMEFITNSQILSDSFRGIYSSNELNFDLKLGYYIINTDPSSSPGKHWVVLYILSTTKAYYFDSLGNKPLREVMTKLKSENFNFEFSNRRLQCESSDVCADYCILFAYFVTQGYRLQDYLSFFGENCIQNDKLVEL